MREEPDFNEEKDMILTEMNDYAMQAETAFTKFVHPSFIKDFTDMFLALWIDEHESALKIAESLQLSELHLWALDGDYLAFRNLFRKEREERKGEYLYDSMQ